MKPQQLLPVIAAALGFAVAWIIKPAPQAPTDGGNAAGSAEGSAPTRPVRGSGDRSRPSSLTEKRPSEVDPGEFPLADQADKGPKTRAEARMLRLAEALDLNMEQQAEIIRVIDETKISTDTEKPLIEDLAARGRKVEETLNKVLTPEQRAKFEELRVRERDNRIESRALKALGQLMEEIDMSPGQRDEALARLRQTEKERIQSIPASATLLLKTSVLPTGPSELTMDGVLTIAGLSDAPQAATPQEAQEQYHLRQRAMLEEKLRCYDGVLTPAQMGQLHAIIAEEQALVDRMRLVKQRPPVQFPEAETVPLPPPDPSPAPEPQE